MEYVLETNAITKRYRGFTALSGLTMRIPKGSIYGLSGATARERPHSSA